MGRYDFTCATVWRLFFAFIFSCGCVQTHAQNLFANPGFEDINTCTEYKAPCASEAWFYIKPTALPIVNTTAAPRFMGMESLWVPVQNIYHPDSAQPLVYTMLLCPLEKDRTYKLTFFLSTLGRPFYKIDFGFSRKEPATFGFDSSDIDATVSMNKTAVVADMKAGWQAFETDYTAKGDERFFILGNITHYQLSFAPKQRMNTSGTVYYFVDEIKLRPSEGSVSCNASGDILKRLYAQNLRHTDARVSDAADEAEVQTDTVSIPAVFFETNKSLLKPSFRKLLDSLADAFSDRKIISLKVEGHTDNAGTKEKNILLSQRRATAVMEYLSEKIPSVKEKLIAEGKGQESPVAQNTTKAGMALNRRVEIIITYTGLRK